MCETETRFYMRLLCRADAAIRSECRWITQAPRYYRDRSFPREDRWQDVRDSRTRTRDVRTMKRAVIAVTKAPTLKRTMTSLMCFVGAPAGPTKSVPLIE